jgi:hypothetical protein
MAAQKIAQNVTVTLADNVAAAARARMVPAVAVLEKERHRGEHCELVCDVQRIEVVPHDSRVAVKLIAERARTVLLL